MKIFKKYLLLTVTILALSQLFLVAQAGAQFTILPSAGTMSDQECRDKIWEWESRGGASYDQAAETADGTSYNIKVSFSASEKDIILGCAIKTGKISLSMIPFFITYFANFLLSISGIICVLFIVLGGYFYIYGGMTEQKDKGKKFIFNALKGMVFSILSWVVVSVIINAITS